jgi:hypothetical protein
MERKYIIPKGRRLFHGTSWNMRRDDYFTFLDGSQSDYNVIWLTEEKKVAEFFAERSAGNEIDPHELLIVMEVEVLRDLIFLDLDTSTFDLYGEQVGISEYSLENGLNDQELLYRHFKEMPQFRRYDGVKEMRRAKGLGGGDYVDLALFNNDGILITRYKYYDLKDEEWTLFLSEEEVLKHYRKGQKTYGSILVSPELLTKLFEILWLHFYSNIQGHYISIHKLYNIFEIIGIPKDKFEAMDLWLIQSRYLFKDEAYFKPGYEVDPTPIDPDTRGLNMQRLFWKLIEPIEGESNLAKRYLRGLLLIYKNTTWEVPNRNRMLKQLLWEYKNIQQIPQKSVYDLEDFDESEKVPTITWAYDNAHLGFCYRNAVKVIDQFSLDIKYVEGYFFNHGILYEHAWNQINEVHFDTTAVNYECVSQFPFKESLKVKDCTYFKVLETDMPTLKLLADYVFEKNPLASRPFADGVKNVYFEYFFLRKS